MHPVLFRVDGFGVPTYGVAMAVAFISAVLLGLRQARRQGLSENRLLDLAFWILGAGLLGSRLLFVLTNAGSYVEVCAAAALGGASAGQIAWECSRALHLWEGGHVFYGGLIAAVLVALWYTRRHRMSFARTADLVVPLVALGHFFGRLGCFAAGCCYGRPTRSGVGVAFPPGSLAHHEMVRGGQLAPTAPHTPPLHPTQLYEAGAELLIYGALVLLHPHRRYYGQLLVAYLVLYPVARVAIELWRADPGRRYLVQLATPRLNRWLGLPAGVPAAVSTSQALGLVSLAAAPLLGRWLERRSRRGAAARAGGQPSGRPPSSPTR